MSEFLLIHGSCHGAWCWHRVIPALAALGHSARAIDLPGHGRDRTPFDQVTLDSYAQAICTALDSPTIVVGHSMAGYPITAAAETDPTHISALVYLCAYAPVSGMTLGDMRRAGPHQPLAPAIRVNKYQGTFGFDPAQTNALFYHDCDAQAQTLATLCLTPQPIAPQETVLTLTQRSQSLPRHYIRCTDDRAIPPEYQAVMAGSVPAAHHTTLPASHSPFFACPDALAQRLHTIAQHSQAAT
ncbi:MAG: alpha/beta fold hydrolase [Pseudotabrizicola sp.]|uniref:alpha/beta fold hydrolase n=1 Tax=Pseudotabrizicola sp. TaxID=2939647 RepID=UPI00273092DD|nr:alpha/beta fold hydrolase [Pseudotabrizicola sp.]MDP2081434.1 alpha/beta fold hydrolase [Pseudotabrizicola sp.]MDZ7572947.1 alpha/beta fold hydrolase [Pseudotabrizicola sp.]